MRKEQALRLLVAAQDDPIVAAWVGVLDEHKLDPSAEVSPYEAWDTFQELHRHGYVPDSSMNTSSLRRGFFGRQRPSSDRLHQAFYNLKILPLEEISERPMPKNDNPFAGRDARSLERREPRGGIATRGAPAPTAPIGPATNPFAGSLYQPPAAPQQQGLNPFSAPEAKRTESALPCRDDGVIDPIRNKKDRGYYCEECGRKVTLHLHTPQDIDESSVQQVMEHIEMEDKVYYGDCDCSGIICHISLGRIPSHVIR